MVHTVGKSLWKVFFPVDVVPVIVPVALAGVLFTTLIGRVAADPDTTRSGAKEQANLAADTLQAQNYRNTFRGFFKERIGAGNISIFPNRV